MICGCRTDGSQATTGSEFAEVSSNEQITDDKITANSIFDLKQRKYDQKKFSWICIDSTRREDYNVQKKLI